MKLVVIKFLVFCLTIVLSWGCSPKQGSGFAPGIDGDSPPNLNPQNSEYVFSYSQQKVTSGGWTVDADLVTPIQSKTLGNGWRVEVRYE